MDWPTHPKKTPLEELGWINLSYAATASPRCDPTIVWGTTVETTELDRFVADERKRTRMIISTAHLLIRATVEALRRHPALNRRMIGRRAYPYDGINVVVPMLETRSGEVNVVYLRHAEKMTTEEVARTLWERARDAAVRVAGEVKRKAASNSVREMARSVWRWFKLAWILRMTWLGMLITNWLRVPSFPDILKEINGAGAFVNFLGFPGAPPMTAYKPSMLPTNSFGVSVTMGLPEPRPVVVDGQVVVRMQASLFVRVDHRLVNGHQTAAFVSTLRDLLLRPEQLRAVEPAVARAA